MELVLLFLAAIPLAAAGMLILVHRSSNFRKLFRWLIVAGVVCGIVAAFLTFSTSTVPIAPYETGRGAWTPVITGVAVASLAGFGIGVLVTAAIGIAVIAIRRRKNKMSSPSANA